MAPSDKPDALVVLPTDLGWMALIGGGRVLRRLTFGHPSADAAVAALDPVLLARAARRSWNGPLLRKLAAYATGKRVDFRDVVIDPGPMSLFRRRVVERCRQIPYGQTATYGELAAAAGSPRAARAVGNCMANNRLPLIVPCHRVVPAGGGIGTFSAPGGSRTKRRLLVLETRSWPWLGRNARQPP